MTYQISELHRAFCATSGHDAPLNATTERFWFDAIKAGMTVNDLKMVLLERKQAIKRGQRLEASLLLRNICGSEERILDVIEEASMLRAKLRCKPVNQAKSAVLRATDRPAFYEDRTTTDPNQKNTAVPIATVIAAMRKAVG